MSGNPTTQASGRQSRDFPERDFWRARGFNLPLVVRLSGLSRSYICIACLFLILSCALRESHRSHTPDRVLLCNLSSVVLRNFGLLLGPAEGFEIRPNVLHAFLVECFDYRLLAFR